LSIDQARRIALAAQGFGRARPARVTASSIARTIQRLGLLQIDCVNVLAMAHHLVLFSRLGPYDRTLFNRVVYGRGEFTEQWAHEASIIPVATWSLLRHRMESHRVQPYGFETFLERHPDYVESVLAEVAARGPLGAGELAVPDGMNRRIPGAWIGTVPRGVLEALFAEGRLAAVQRRPDFSRTYDLAERRIDPKHLGRQMTKEEAQRELLHMAARAHGVGVAADLADYYRMPVGEARPRLAELVESGALAQVRVEGWREPAYLDREAQAPRRLDRSALLAPFDPVVWFRPRAARLFDFEYRLEIFVPKAQRRWGYYVLPFLHADRIVARVDLRADRAAKKLVVAAAYLEPGAEAEETAAALGAELETLAGWLTLDRVTVERRSPFDRLLKQRLPAC
jgi:uncharacterized protein